MIRKVNWKNHKILGDLELDFTKSDGSTYNTIILTGENGTGKTTILESLNNFLTLEQNAHNFDYMEYETNENCFKIIPLEDNNLRFHNRINLVTDTKETIRRDKVNSSDSLDNDKYDIRSHGCIYSKSKSDFVTKPITMSSTKQLDLSKYESDKNDDYTSIKQL